MKRWNVAVTYTRTDWYCHIEAETGEEAKQIVLSGECEVDDKIDDPPHCRVYQDGE